jgi:cytochrome c
MLVLALLLGVVGCRGGADDAPEGPEPVPPPGATNDPSQPDFYTLRVRPVFVHNCAHCHFGWAHRGGFAMDTRAAMMKGGKDGAAIVPGNPNASRLMKALRHEPGPKPMPQNRKLSDRDIETVRRWIEAGAIMP